MGFHPGELVLVVVIILRGRDIEVDEILCKENDFDRDTILLDSLWRNLLGRQT